MIFKTNVDFEKAEWIYKTPDGRLIINTHRLYIYLKDNYHLFVTRNCNNYLYYNGVYHLLNDVELKAFIKMFLPEEIRTKHHWEAVFEEFKTDNPVEDDLLNADENIINFKNGIYDITENKLKEHSPDILSTIQIPCNYTEAASLKDAPLFKKYLEDLQGDDDVTKKFLLEYIGAIISNVQGNRFKKVLLLVGKGNTGKTQLREFVISLIGAQNNISIDLKNLNEPFGVANLVNKRLAGSGDMSYAKVSEINVLKELTGGDDIYGNVKYKPQFSFKYNGFLWFNCNDLPLFGGDNGEHVYERFMVVTCNNVIPKEKRDSFLLNKLLSEKDIVASVCVKHLRLAINRGYKFVESEAMEIDRDLYRIQNHNLLAFLKETCSIGNGRTLRTEFNLRYFSWCRFNNYKPFGKNSITKILTEEYGVKLTKSNGDIYYELSFHDDFLYEQSNELDKEREFKLKH